MLFNVGNINLQWYLLKNNTFSLKNFKILRPKVTKVYEFDLKCFVNIALTWSNVGMFEVKKSNSDSFPLKQLHQYVGIKAS